MNIFTSLLSILKVKHTKSFSERHYAEHPYRDTLYGIARMLSDYSISNIGLKLNDKNEIITVHTPFIAQVANNFVLVTLISTNTVEYIWRDKKIKIPIEKFKEIWSGVILLVEATEESSEPNYTTNLRIERFTLIEKVLAVTLFVSLICFSFLNSYNKELIGRLLLLLVQCVGLYISFLLLLKQVNANSQSADKICSLFKKSDCNDVLDTPAAKFMGVVSWSEIGFAYFLSNILITASRPDLLMYLAIINFLALPYTVWSVWYQKFKVKQWCLLCLIIQFIIWLTFIIDCLFGMFSFPAFEIKEILYIVFIFLAPLLFLDLLTPKLIAARKVENLIHEYSNLRLNEDVFLTHLKHQPYYEVDKTTSCVIFGNSSASLQITILTNPHCNPCAKMHAQIDLLRKEANDEICIQYIFSSFNKELESSGRYLAALYMNHCDDLDFVQSCYNDWFAGAKNDRYKFFDKYKISIDKENVNQEYSKHIQWRDKSKLQATPTILINGYELPNNYTLEDLKYFLYLSISD